MKYRKKPVLVEAVQYTGSNFSTIKEFADGCDRRVAMAFDDEVVIRTLEGDMIARPGDWIIKGVHGELYPCKPDIFAETYEEAEDKHFADAGKMLNWFSADQHPLIHTFSGWDDDGPYLYRASNPCLCLTRSDQYVVARMYFDEGELRWFTDYGDEPEVVRWMSIKLPEVRE